MPTAADLLDWGASTDSAVDANRLTISEDLRTISVPEGQSILGVTNDSDVRRVWFTMPDECDGTDLTGFDIFVNYTNASGVNNRYEATDMVASDGTITFSWLVNRLAFTAAGTVTFNVNLRLFDADGETVVKEFNTVPAAMTVLEGLEAGEFNAAYAYVDEIRAALNGMVSDALDARRTMSFQGSVQSVSNLPQGNVLAGSVYNVTATGRDYLWTGDSWDDLGGMDTFAVTEATDADIDAMFE